MEQHLYLKGSKTSYFITKSYFYKILMTEGSKTFYFQPLTLWRLLDFTILKTDISSSSTVIIETLYCQLLNRPSLANQNTELPGLWKPNGWTFSIYGRIAQLISADDCQSLNNHFHLYFI